MVRIIFYKVAVYNDIFQELKDVELEKCTQ